MLEQIVEVARENQLVIFSDEIYDRLVMDGQEHVSIASLAPDLFCITFNGLSKSHMIAGYRIGWMSLSGNKRIAHDVIEGINMLSNMRLCSNVPAQSIVQTCLGGIQRSQGYLVPGGRIFEQRKYVYERLCNMEGVSAVHPDAAFYIFPHLDPKKFNITDDDQFALDLLKDKHVLIVRRQGLQLDHAGVLPHCLSATPAHPRRGDGQPRGLPQLLSPVNSTRRRGYRVILTRRARPRPG